MTYDIGMLLDGLILVFLCVTIFYAARLSMFLKVFREGKTGMEVLIRDLSLTINKAETAIKAMKIHAQETEGELREVINQAKFLSDELGFMNETGDSLANRLEKLADRNRELVDLMENAGGIGTQKITPFDPRSNTAKSGDVWSKPKAAKKEAPQKYIQAEDDFEISDFDIDEDDERDFMALSDGAYKADELAHKPKVNTEAKSKLRSFAIFDREHSDDRDGDIEIKNDLARAYDEEDDDREFHSNQKEREFHSQAEQDLYEALQRKKKTHNKVSQVS